jgi:hypothetical protein
MRGKKRLFGFRLALKPARKRLRQKRIREGAKQSVRLFRLVAWTHTRFFVFYTFAKRFPVPKKQIFKNSGNGIISLTICFK